MKLKMILDDGAFAPSKAHISDAGFDLRTPIDFDLDPQSHITIDTGVHILIPDGFVGLLTAKSGLNVRMGITSTGTIDAGYTGSIVAKLYREDISNGATYHFKAGDKITQLVILPIPMVDLEAVDEFDVETDRGSNGFGSSGR